MGKRILPVRRVTSLFCFFLLKISLMAEPTELERLWNGAIASNVELKSAEIDRSATLLNRRYAASIYAPSVTVSAADTRVPDSPGKDLGSFYDYSRGSVTYGQPLTGGLNITTVVNCEIDRPLTQIGTVAAQTPGLSVSMVQSLLPWWIQGSRNDPQIARLDNAVGTLEISLLQKKRDIMVQITNDYLNLRKAMRSEMLLEKTVAIDKETLESYRQLFRQGAVENVQVWDQSQKMLDNTMALQETRSSISELREKIRVECGIDPFATQSGGLPEFSSLENTVEPSEMKNLDKHGLEHAISSIGIERALRRQASAPSVSLAVAFSWPLDTEPEKDWRRAWTEAWEEKTEPQYTISLGFDISSLFSGALKRDSEIDAAKLAALSARRESAITSYENQKALIKERIASVRDQTESSLEILSQTRLFLEDAEKLAAQGGITPLELETYRNQLFKREIDAENNRDQLWYWKWLFSCWYG